MAFVKNGLSQSLGSVKLATEKPTATPAPAVEKPAQGK